MTTKEPDPERVAVPLVAWTATVASVPDPDSVAMLLALSVAELASVPEPEKAGDPE